MLLKEVILKLATLSKEDREFIAERLDYIRKERVMTIRMDLFNLKPRPRKDFWIPKCMNKLTLIITNGVDYDYTLSIMR